MDGRYEDCLRLRAQAIGYIERFLQKRPNKPRIFAGELQFSVLAMGKFLT